MLAMFFEGKGATKEAIEENTKGAVNDQSWVSRFTSNIQLLTYLASLFRY